MSGKKRKPRRRKAPIESGDIEGLRYFDQLAPMLERLRDVGTDRDKAGNRELFMDQYCLLVLLFLFNPIVDSLRGIQQASELKKVQKRLGCSRASLGSLSEATDVFDQERLREIVEELGGRVRAIGKNPSLKDVRTLLTAVDGSVVKTLSRVAEATHLKSPSTGKPTYAWRLHMQFEVDRHVPSLLEVTGASSKGRAGRALRAEKTPRSRSLLHSGSRLSEVRFVQFDSRSEKQLCLPHPRQQLLRSGGRVAAERGRTRGECGSRHDHNPRVRPSRQGQTELTRYASWSSRQHLTRIAARTAGHESDGYIRLATDMLDVPADLIALIYQHRWTIEIFFRFLKHILGCRKLISTDPVGVEIQMYCAIIACLLISLYTGRQPTKRTYEMICFYFIGWATEDELLAHIQKLKSQEN